MRSAACVLDCLIDFRSELRVGLQGGGGLELGGGFGVLVPRQITHAEMIADRGPIGCRGRGALEEGGRGFVITAAVADPAARVGELRDVRAVRHRQTFRTLLGYIVLYSAIARGGRGGRRGAGGGGRGAGGRRRGPGAGVV